MADQEEIVLTGGRVTAGVVRVADTVRRPLGSHSPFVHQLLKHLESRRVSCVPRFLGIDARGREILTYIAGTVPSDLGEFSDAQLSAAARILRNLHDGTVDCDLRDGCEIVCHGDPSPCNYVFSNEVPIAIIDFDAARPGLRREDVGYAAWMWLDIGEEDASPRELARRLRLFAEAYGAVSSQDIVPSILAVQDELATRPDVPVRVRTWAGQCRNWLEHHRAAIRSG